MHRMANLTDAGAGRWHFGAPWLGRVLVVADDPGARDMIIGHLTGHQCAAVGSTPADLTRHLQHHPFSLVVLDTRHRPYDGIGMLRSIRVCPGDLQPVTTMSVAAHPCLRCFESHHGDMADCGFATASRPGRSGFR